MHHAQSWRDQQPKEPGALAMLAMALAGAAALYAGLFLAMSL